MKKACHATFALGQVLTNRAYPSTKIFTHLIHPRKNTFVLFAKSHWHPLETSKDMSSSIREKELLTINAQAVYFPIQVKNVSRNISRTSTTSDDLSIAQNVTQKARPRKIYYNMTNKCTHKPNKAKLNN